ncbi:hypothetical protein RD792_006810 [Penstemon davidsonii]|uniref:Filament-like plant protein 3 n=1 Tax=Penstemon davidsonii TaxID=160366 RepID=A0ABR0DCD5_9LAMI|nr:hypothetical protein RD792_006810 [Penstemon davidsonii]
MDRRSWLWRRKSSEKSPSGETESSGSASSHSGRFSGDQNNIQSPEVTSKAVLGDEEELNDSVNKTLSEKLSEALDDLRDKEDLVKQHSKVAEEAVSGWERAENEVLVLKKQVDVLTHKNSNLEERVGHLDGALKECLRQLRQAREEQEEKIYNAVIKKSSEWESTKSELENQISQLQNAKTNNGIDTMMLSDVNSKLEAAEKENSILKLKLQSKAQDLDLSTHANEVASKHHLNNIKKIAKLEAECLRLKAASRKSTLFSENESNTSKNERSLGRSLIAPSIEIDLMDDFLEMERLAAIQEPCSEKPSREIEEKLKKVEEEKVKLEIDLNECQIKLKQNEVKLLDLSTQLSLANEAKKSTEVKLKNTTMLLDEAETNLVQIQNQLIKSNEAINIVNTEVKVRESELQTLHSSIGALEEKLNKERKISYEALAKCEILDTELSNLKLLHKSTIVEEFKLNQDKELAVAASKFAECQKTIASLGRQLKSLATLDDFLIDSELQETVL